MLTIGEVSKLYTIHNKKKIGIKIIVKPIMITQAFANLFNKLFSSRMFAKAFSMFNIVGGVRNSVRFLFSNDWSF